MATDPSPAGRDDAGHERIVVRLPLSVPTVIRMLAAFGQEFPGVRLVDDPPRSVR